MAESEGERALRLAADTLRELEAGDAGIRATVAAFRPLYQAFRRFLEQLGGGGVRNDLYFDLLDELFQWVYREYGVESGDILVYPGWTIDNWGPLYWLFLHRASVLVQHALARGRVDSDMGLAAILWNLDCILPCPECTAHYLGIKHTDEIVRARDFVAYGHVVQGVYLFHDCVTRNIARSRGVAAHDEQGFAPQAFARKYSVYPISSRHMLVSTDTERLPLHWMSPEHVDVCTLLSAVLQKSILDVSGTLKRLGAAAELDDTDRATLRTLRETVGKALSRAEESEATVKARVPHMLAEYRNAVSLLGQTLRRKL